MELTGKLYYCTTCGRKYSEGQSNFHKGHNTREDADAASSDAATKEAAQKTARTVTLPSGEEMPAKGPVKVLPTVKPKDELFTDYPGSSLTKERSVLPSEDPAEDLAGPSAADTGDLSDKSLVRELMNEYGPSNINIRKYPDSVKFHEKSRYPKTAADVSDQVPPMGWEGKGQDDQPAGAGAPMPPNPALQQGENTTDQQGNPVLYDSNQDRGPQFQTTINPKDKSVTVKFLDSDQEQALQKAIGNPQPPAAAPPAATPPGAPPGPGGPAAGAPAQPADLSKQNVPVEF